MARDLLQDKARNKTADSIQGSLNQLEDAAKQIVAVAIQLANNRSVVVTGVATGEYDQADLDKLDSLTGKVAALKSAADTFLA